MKIIILQNWDLKKIIWTEFFIVSNDFLFLLEYYWKKYHIRIPRWFITDFWSIPPIFFYFDKTKYISYIMHDYLYNYIWKIININWELKYNQALADDILVAWLKTEWMWNIWRIQVLSWLMIWWRFNFKTKKKKISKITKKYPIYFWINTCLT